MRGGVYLMKINIKFSQAETSLTWKLIHGRYINRLRVPELASVNTLGVSSTVTTPHVTTLSITAPPHPPTPNQAALNNTHHYFQISLGTSLQVSICWPQSFTVGAGLIRNTILLKIKRYSPCQHQRSNCSTCCKREWQIRILFRRLE